MYGAKLAQMEQQHQVLENNLKKFLDLKKELSSFQQEAEESDRVVNDFIKVWLKHPFLHKVKSVFQAVVPDFTTTTKKRSKKVDQEEEEEHKSKMTKSHGKPPLPSNLYRANPVQTDPGNH